MLSSSNLVALAALWMSAVSPGGAEAHRRGSWGSSYHHHHPDGRVVAANRRSTRRGHHHHHLGGADPVTELVRDFIFHLPAYPNSLMRPDQDTYLSSSGDRDEERQPRMDVSEDGDGATRLTMEIPGVSDRDLTIELENDHVLKINGVRRTRSGGSGRKQGVLDGGYISETKFGRSIRLKDTVDPDRMEANLSHGVLTIKIPEKPTKIRKLSISTEERSSILDPPRPSGASSASSREEERVVSTSHKEEATAKVDLPETTDII